MRGKKPKHVVQGFTVLELLLVMILGGIISGMVYQLMGVFFGLAQTHEKQTDASMHLQQMYWMVSKDIHAAEHIHKTADGIEIVGENQVKISFDDTGLTRTSGTMVDRLEFSAGNMHYQFPEGGKEGLVNLFFEYQGVPVQWTFHKKFTAEEQLKRQAYGRAGY